MEKKQRPHSGHSGPHSVHSSPHRGRQHTSDHHTVDYQTVPCHRTDTDSCHTAACHTVGPHRGRPPKKSYDPAQLMQELIDTVVEVYREKKEIKATAIELSLPPNKVKKLLITAGVLNYPETAMIQSLQAQGKTMAEIQAITGLSRSTVNTYLPYTKVIYKMSEISQNAERVKRYKARKRLREDCTEENLWNCIVVHQGDPFFTASGLPFTYSLKVGRGGEYTRELFIDRRENSKSLAWSSVRIVFERAVEKRGSVFDRPKAIADVRGVSYVYSLLWRFGVISVPEDVEERLRGEKPKKTPKYGL